MNKDMSVTVRVDELQKLQDALKRARNPSVQFSRDNEVMRERAIDCVVRELEAAMVMVEIMMHP